MFFAIGIFYTGWFYSITKTDIIEVNKCLEIPGCEKYRCMADADISVMRKNNALLEYQMCLDERRK